MVDPRLSVSVAEQVQRKAKGHSMNDVHGMHRMARDRTRITAADPLEIRYWATTLRCRQVECCAAVNAVGTNSDEVSKHLEEHQVA